MEEDYDFDEETYHEDYDSRKEILLLEYDIEARVSTTLKLPME